MLDTLKLTKQLEEGGFTHAQAATMVNVLRESLEQGDLANRIDLANLSTELKAELHSALTTMRADLHATVAKIESSQAIQISNAEIRLTKWTITAMIALTALFGAIVKLF